ncbi:MAG: hypothetical protein ACWGPN_06490, partial [Gammaproteobacteria bacterium]
MSLLFCAAFAQDDNQQEISIPAINVVEVPASALAGTTATTGGEAGRGVVMTDTILLPGDLFKDAPPQDGPRTIVRIWISEDSFVDLDEERRITRDGRTAIYGQVLMHDNSTFTFTRSGGSLRSGEIQLDGELITFTGPREVDGDIEFRLVVWRPGAFPEEASPNEARSPSRGVDPGRSDESQGPEVGQSDETEVPIEFETLETPIEIEVLVVYTSAAAVQAGLVVGDIELAIDDIVWSASQRMQDQAGVKLNVTIEAVDYVETGDMAVDLERLECPCDHRKKGVGDNHLNEVF